MGTGSICVLCGENKQGQFEHITLGVILPLFLIIWYLVSWRPFFAKQRAPDDQEQGGGICAHACFQTDLCNKAKLVVVYAYDSDITDFINIFISFWQIISTFESTYSVKFPEVLTRMWEFGAVLRYDTMPLVCANSLLSVVVRPSPSIL